MFYFVIFWFNRLREMSAFFSLYTFVSKLFWLSSTFSEMDSEVIIGWLKLGILFAHVVIFDGGNTELCYFMSMSCNFGAKSSSPRSYRASCTIKNDCDLRLSNYWFCENFPQLREMTEKSHLNCSFSAACLESHGNFSLHAYISSLFYMRVQFLLGTAARLRYFLGLINGVKFVFSSKSVWFIVLWHGNTVLFSNVFNYFMNFPNRASWQKKLMMPAWFFWHGCLLSHRTGRRLRNKNFHW